MSESEIAVMEGEMIGAEDDYFDARPQIDTMENRRVFEAGFRAAWNRAASYNMPNGQD